MSSSTDNTIMRETYEGNIADKWELYDSKLPTKTMVLYHKEYDIAKCKKDDESELYWLGKADEEFNRFNKTVRSLGIDISNYRSPKTQKDSILVKGDTKPFKDSLKEKGGKWNKILEGWVLPTKKRNEIIDIVFPPRGEGGGGGGSGRSRSNSSDSFVSAVEELVPLLVAVWNILTLEYPDILNVNFDSPSVLVVGEVQSGKSAFTFALLLWKLLNKRGAVMVLRNYTKDAIHMMAKIQRFSTWLRGELEKHYPTTVVPDCLFEGVYVPDFLNKKKDEYGWYEVNGLEVGLEHLSSGNKVILTICNPHQLFMVNRLLECYEGSLVVAVDEADALGYSERNEQSGMSAAEELESLYERAENKYEISGTVMDVMVANEELTGADIVKIRPTGSYKGVTDVEYVALRSPIGVWKVDDNFENSDPNMLGFYESLKKEGVFKAEEHGLNVDHPIVVLHKTDVRIEHHHQFLVWHKNKALGWTVVTECSKTQDFGGLRMYDSRLVGSVLKFKGKELHADADGVFNFPDSAIFPELFQWMYDNGGAEFFSHIVVKSGRFSGRSRSYVSDNGEWHLTHQYYSGADNVPSLIQEQRLLHNRPDNIRLKCYAEVQVCKDIIKGYRHHQESVERMTKEVAHEKYVHEYLNEQKWNEGKIPKVKVVSPNKTTSGFKPETVDDSEYDGGVRLGEYRRMLGKMKTVDGSSMGRDAWSRGEDGRLARMRTQVRNAVRTIIQRENITSMRRFLEYKGGVSYAKMYRDVGLVLGRPLEGTEKAGIRDTIHNMSWWRED